MRSMKPINRKARKVEAALIEATGDVEALQRRGGEGKIYYPMGCTLNFTPGWEVDISGGTAGDINLPARREVQRASHRIVNFSFAAAALKSFDVSRRLDQSRLHLSRLAVDRFH